MKVQTFFSLLALTSMLACSDNIKNNTLPQTTFLYNFESDMEGWKVAYSDYPVDSTQHSIYELDKKHTSLPTNLTPNTKGIMVTGHNRSDDLFMYLKRQLIGLKPNQTYQFSFKVTLASQYPLNSVGIGGSPGASVYLKGGANQEEPTNKVATDNFLRNTWDIGSQSNAGSNTVLLGTIGIDGDEVVYKRIQRSNTAKFTAKTDANGKIWVCVGTDSGYEGKTTLYYDSIEIIAQEI